MSIELKMPALSPTMEEGAIARWLVKEGDTVAAGDLIAEIETDKATMEFEAVDEGTISRILVPGGTDGVKVGTVIALIENEDSPAEAPKLAAAPAPEKKAEPAPKPAAAPAPVPAPVKASTPPATANGTRIKASPLARRLAQGKGIDLASLHGTGPGGRIVKADLDAAAGAPVAAAASAPVQAPAAAPVAPPPAELPYEAIKLSSMRKVIARRLTESKQTVPHFYLTVDCNIDPLLALRAELNASLEKRGIKLSVNDLVVKALAVALIEVPDANVQFAGEELYRFARADISVAVAIPGGLITPVITDASGKSVATIASEARDLAERARAGKLQPHEYMGGTASISNLGMYGIKQFDAVINPPQAMILAVGAGEKRPHIVNDQLSVATVMTATGSFDHRAIDGAVGAELMQAFKRLIENPLGMLA